MISINVSNPFSNKNPRQFIDIDKNGQSASKTEGGFRTRGHFKHGYIKKNNQWYLYNNFSQNIEPIYFNQEILASELPLFTIVTVVFNGASYLEKTIQSIKNQIYSNIEYIIIDGGSTDETLNIIKKNEEIIDYWVSECDNGIYDAMNKGLHLASGKWLLYLNAGDQLVVDLWQVIKSIPSPSSSSAVLLGSVNVCDEDDCFLYQHRAVLNGKKDFIFKIPACHQAIFYNRLLMNEFDIKYKIIADKVHLFNIYKKLGPNSIYIFPLIISSYPLGGYSEKMRKIYHSEEAYFFSTITNSGKFGEILANLYLKYKYKLYELAKWSGLWLAFKRK